MIVPLAVISVMLAYVVSGEMGKARSAADTAQLVRDSTQVTKLIDAVQTEHRQALLVSLRYEAAGPGKGAPDTAAYLAAQDQVGTRIDAVRAAYQDRLPDGEAQALKELEGLDSLRKSVEQGPIPADNIDPAYGSVIEGLIDGLGLGRSGNESSASAGNLLDALLRADTAHASFETSVFAARTRDANALIEFTGAVGDYDQYTYQAERFTRFAGPEQGTDLAEIEHSPYQSVITQHWAALQVDTGALVAENAGQLRAALDEALRAGPTYERQAENRLKIVQSLITQIAANAQSASDAAWWRVVWLVAGILAAFAAWLLFSVMTRRSVVRTVRALTAAAQHVAGAAKSELARVADDDADDAGPPRLEAVPVPVRDEIGELAEAFNQVQITASALLARQVVSRRNIAEMFGNVGRRVSNLTARQLALIDSVERGETDPDVLDRLYRIDHIAVRLQRNADSLMLLAGITETGLNTEPMRLSNIVRAALGQIEGYQRVTPHAEGDVTVVPDIVGDLTLMLAELLENAVMFSPATSGVEVVLRPRHQGGGALVEIIDHGLGMSPERLDQENARLIRRERLDLAPTEVLGLFVVGGLSRRWGIEVALSRTPGGGVTATVAVPAVHLVSRDPGPAAERAPRIEPPARRPGPSEPRRARVEAPPGPAGLPRRVPSWSRAAESSGHARRSEATDTGAERAATHGGARPGTGAERAATHGGARPGTGADPAPTGPARSGDAGPLRRRVRGATLSAATASSRLPRPTEPPTHRRPPSWQPTDAEAARSEIDEFEAAVLRAERESAAEDRTSAVNRPGGAARGPAGIDPQNSRPSSPEGMST
ncbi:ATP-binding protein [Streptomyces sp. NPDC059618]|uniref:sensor histidine kinase n=1 Tax=Streptomyces sp. NPDC059618 TaxID=3346887 RepID=UPI0036740A43